MPASQVFASGTQTAVITTEHSLSAPAIPGAFTLAVDLSNMAAGDAVELRVKQKVLTGGTLQTVYYQRFMNAQAEPYLIAFSELLDADLGATFTLKQIAGTGRNFDWKVLYDPQLVLASSVNDAGATTTAFIGAAGLSATDDFYKGSALCFVGGTLKDIARKISGYTGATKSFAFSGAAGTTDAAWPTAPANGDAFVIVGRIG